MICEWPAFRPLILRLLFWHIRDMWGTIGMVLSWGIWKRFHISCWPFHSGVFDQNKFTWMEIPEQFDLWCWGLCVEISGTCEAPLEWSCLEDSEKGFIFLVGLFVPELLIKTSLPDLRVTCILTFDVEAVVLTYQGHVGHCWNGLVLRILKKVSYFLLAFSFRSYWSKQVYLICEWPAFQPLMLRPLFWHIRDMWGTVGMVLSWGIWNRFHISCWPFRSGVIDQNKFTWMEIPEQFDLWCWGRCVEISGTCGASLEWSCLLCRSSQSKVSQLLGHSSQGKVSQLLSLSSQVKVSQLLSRSSQGKVSQLLCRSRQGKVSQLLCRSSQGKVSQLLCRSSQGKVSLLLSSNQGKVSVCSEAAGQRFHWWLLTSEDMLETCIKIYAFLLFSLPFHPVGFRMLLS